MMRDVTVKNIQTLSSTQLKHGLFIHEFLSNEKHLVEIKKSCLKNPFIVINDTCVK